MKYDKHNMVEGKIHWCGWCKQFVNHTEEDHDIETPVEEE